MNDLSISFNLKIKTGRTVSTVAESSRSCFGLWHSSYRCWGNRKWAWLCCRIGTWCSRCLFRNKVFSRPLVFLSADIWKQSLLFVVSIVLCSRYNGTWTFRFVATEESFAHPIYKKKLIEMSRTDYTNVFGRARWPDAPQRVLETPFYAGWKNNLSDHETEESQPIIGHSIIHGMVCIWILDLPWIRSLVWNLKLSFFSYILFCIFSARLCYLVQLFAHLNTPSDSKYVLFEESWWPHLF